MERFNIFKGITGKINLLKVRVIRLDKYNGKTFIQLFLTVSKVYLYRRRYKITEISDKILEVVNLLTGNPVI